MMKYKKRLIKFILIFVVLPLILTGCSNNQTTKDNQNPPAPPSTKAKFVNITPKEAKQRLDSGEDLILLDVRTTEEYASGHIKDSILIPVTNLEEKAEGVLKDKEKPVLVYCRSGNRSAAAADILVRLGYKNVYNLGGLNNWPYEIEK